jgi:hypothetical protein
MFFGGKGEVHQTMQRLVRRLNRAGIPYVIVGGMAVNAYGYERMTKDVDVLLTREGLRQFQRLLVPKYYQRRPGLQRRFIERKTQRGVDVLVTGFFPGSGKPGPIAYPDPTKVGQQIKRINFLGLPTLIQLKLAARRYQDFADVVNLIAVHNLDESYLKRLHRSVHGDFVECLEEKRREDEYLARNG